MRGASRAWCPARRIDTGSSTWKTLIPCEKEPLALIAYLRSGAPVHVTRFEPGHAASALAA